AAPCHRNTARRLDGLRRTDQAERIDIYARAAEQTDRGLSGGTVHGEGKAVSVVRSRSGKPVPAAICSRNTNRLVTAIAGQDPAVPLDIVEILRPVAVAREPDLDARDIALGRAAVLNDCRRPSGTARELSKRGALRRPHELVRGGIIGKTIGPDRIDP